MSSKILKALDKFYHDVTIADLRLRNSAAPEKHKLSYNDELYLSIIEGHSGEYTASNIAKMLCISKPSVTQKINELEQKGYISKIQSETDKRIFYLHSNGSEILTKYNESGKKVDDTISSQLNSKYSEEQISTFCEMIAEIGEIYLDEVK